MKKCEVFIKNLCSQIPPDDFEKQTKSEGTEKEKEMQV